MGYIPAGPRTSGSSRLQVYLPSDRLAESPAKSVFVLRRPEKFSRKLRVREVSRILLEVLWRRISTVVFQKVHKGAAPALMRLLRLFGRRIIYVEADARSDVAFVKYVDAIVAPSRALAEDLGRRSGVPTYHIPDPVEHWDRSALDRPWLPKDRYRCVWVGGHKNWHQIERLKTDLRTARYNAFDIVTISDHRNADLPWKLDTVRKNLGGADLGIIPTSDDQAALMKSHNRATLFMALGIPLLVRASPVYANLVLDGETAFVFHNAEDLKAITKRLETSSLVEAIRSQAMRAAEDYHLDRVAGLWAALFRM